MSIKKKTRPVKIITLDTETYGFDGDIRRIAIYDGDNVYYGYNFNDIEDRLIMYYNMGFDVHIYVHNMEFDARKIPKIFYYGNINWDKTKQINGRYVVITNKYYTWHDSFRILPMSLKELSSSFGVEHEKIDLMEKVRATYGNETYKDEGDYFCRCDVDDPIYLEYLGYDVISLYEVLEKLLEVSGLKPEELVKRMSTASLSKYIFKHGYKGKAFMTEGQNQTDYDLLTTMNAWTSGKCIRDSSGIPLSYRDIEDKIRLGYYGGRTEVFIPFYNLDRDTRKKTLRHYDVNSLYPSQMIKNEYPYGYPKFYNDPDIVEMNYKKWLKYHEGLGFIRVKAYIPKMMYPPLPVKMGKLVFPTGYIEGTYTYRELEYAISCGVEILEYIEMIHFEKTFKLFKNFIDVFGKLKVEGKETGNKALTQLAKLLMNTAYGYLCMNRDDKDELHPLTDENLEKFADRLINVNDDYGYIKVKSIVCSDSIQVAAGSTIISDARLVLIKAIHEVEKKGGKVYYCDTDSIVTDIELPAEMVHKSELGKWDLEGELISGIFLQPKVYTEYLAEKDKNGNNKVNIKFKGVGKKFQKDLTFDFYAELLKKLQKNSKEKVTVEQGHLLLPSIGFLQKTGKAMNTVQYRDKAINLANKQKRNIDYLNNTSAAWHMDSLEMFSNFNFNKEVKAYMDYGNPTNVCS